LPGSTPSVIACGDATFPKGGAGERSEPEGVIPQRRAFAESGAATAVFRYDLTCENGTPGRPQTLRCSEIINILSAIYAQSNAERIQNRPTQKAAAALSCAAAALFVL